MKKQFYMVVTMIAMLTVAGLSSAKAQTQPGMKLKANIPFAFTVGNQTLPAGEYVIRVVNAASDVRVLQLRSRDGQAIAQVQTHGVIGKTQDGAKLVFNRYGAEYFFGQAWLPSDSLGMQGPKSHTEKQLARELAANKQTRETVAITVQR